MPAGRLKTAQDGYEPFLAENKAQQADELADVKGIKMTSARDMTKDGTDAGRTGGGQEFKDIRCQVSSSGLVMSPWQALWRAGSGRAL